MPINPFMRTPVFYPNGGGTKIGLPDNSNPVGGGSYEPPTSDGDMGLTPPPAGGPPISTDGPGGTDPSGGGGFMDQLNKWLTGGGDGPLTSNAARLAALATAFNNYRDAGRAIDTSKRAAEIANPFGKYREFYGDRLKSLYDDPSQIENTPGYKFALQQGIGATERANASQGYLGSGKMSTDLMDYAQGLASQTFDKERNALMQMSGAQFNPANGAEMLMRGEDIARRSRGDALAALGHLLDPGKSVTNITNNGTDPKAPYGRGPDGQPKNPFGKTPNQPGGNTPDSQFYGPATRWIEDQIRRGFKIDPNDPHVAEAIREGSPPGFYNDAPDPFKDPQGFDRWQQQQNDDIMRRYGGSPDDGSGGGGGSYDDGSGDTSGGYGPGYGDNPFPDPSNPINIDDINWDDPSFWDSIGGGYFDP